jgi:hypothetical protein
MAITQPIRELYRSANGDRWSLIRQDGRIQVLHEPNAASGCRPSRLEIGDFLARDAHGPQHALLRLIGTLVGDVRPGRVADLIPTQSTNSIRAWALPSYE